MGPMPWYFDDEDAPTDSERVIDAACVAAIEAENDNVRQSNDAADILGR